MDTINVTATPAVIETNFTALKVQLEKELQDFDVVVTADTVKESKARATTLNKLSGQIDERRKAEVAKVAEPIKAFESQAKDLSAMCQKVRESILTQVRVFESETLAIVSRELESYRDAMYEKHEVRAEFQNADVAGMEKLSWLTSKGNLTSAALRFVDELVGRSMIKQQTTDLRIAQLEVESHRAGLHAPLVREHVEGILFASDDQYLEGLQRLVKRELQRQEETERKARERFEAEEAEINAAVAAADQREESVPSSETVHQVAEGFQECIRPDAVPPAEEPAQIAGKKTIQIDLLMHVQVDPSVSVDQVRDLLLKKLTAAGVDKSITRCTAKEIDQLVNEVA